MAKEALLIAICIGSRPLVELILTIFQDFPHEERCGKCDLCLRMSNSNIDALRKVDVFRAVSSEAFLWLATDDPFAAACSLAQDIERCMENDNFEFMVRENLHTLA
ncbi:hypothetical protein KIN20_004747 [Parelaphostrongylus tenuis]|uniref:Transient receptor ion channel domain-containing protein n=1 Tax=Parelaphostrongylus tenuis TaxID=148309 RepID=A0AAD5M3K2_PARTN|nr:hypothetical protein KIN20_004747 [Parelaphostrongylus tenuis]